MTIPAPHIGATVQFFPGAAERTGGFGPRAAIVTAIGGAAPDWGVALIVFQQDGTTGAHSRVIHQTTWTAAGSPDAVGYWSWLPAGTVFNAGQ